MALIWWEAQINLRSHGQMWIEAETEAEATSAINSMSPEELHNVLELIECGTDFQKATVISIQPQFG
jgi:hypothetical protein